MTRSIRMWMHSRSPILAKSGRSGKFAEFAAIGGTGQITIGSPERVADELQALIDETGIDGFNLAYAVTPETFEDFVDLVIPELQRRGVYKTAYAEGSLRNKLFGQGDRLGETHPAHTFGATSRTLAA
ncbi:Dibenzothiophene sulfone monooxygenase [Granulibacter bethesdensis]|uniref:hypothetical protein n=1 Tax=Granulibacter bethesdensis TaxID=364410 RepID=UPI00090B2BA8|nr:Dibenzothiophene sulfone monooxygenase [Granulibacter bethesdensis]